MPIYHPLRAHTGQSNEQAASKQGQEDEEERGAVQKLYEGLAGLTPTQFDELEEALIYFNNEIHHNRRVEDDVLSPIGSAFWACIERSEYMYDDKAESALWGISVLAYDPNGFEVAVQCLFRLIDKHCSAGTILRPDPSRHWVHRARREREEMEAVEFVLLRILSTHWRMTCCDAGPIVADPTILLDAFFRKHGSFPRRWGGNFEFVGRLAAISHTRQVAIMTSNKALAARLPTELVEIVQDSICDVEGIKKLLWLVGETDPESIERIWGQWMNDNFSKLLL